MWPTSGGGARARCPAAALSRALPPRRADAPACDALSGGGCGGGGNGDGGAERPRRAPAWRRRGTHRRARAPTFDLPPSSLSPGVSRRRTRVSKSRRERGTEATERRRTNQAAPSNATDPFSSSPQASGKSPASPATGRARGACFPASLAEAARIERLRGERGERSFLLFLIKRGGEDTARWKPPPFLAFHLYSFFRWGRCVRARAGPPPCARALCIDRRGSFPFVSSPR